MINLKILSAAAVVALAAPAMMPAQSFAQTPFHRPAGNLAARAAPSGGPRVSGGGAPRFNGGGNFNGGQRFSGGGNYHHGNGGFVAGAAAGAVIGGALASQGPRYYGSPYYANDPSYYNDYAYDGGPEYAGDGPVVVEGPVAVQGGPGGDDVAYCMQTYRSYDRRSGTYLGFDGMRHPCP